MTQPVADGNLLYLDTTSTYLMVGVSTGGVMRFKNKELYSSFRYHSATLIPTIQEGLVKAGIGIRELTGLAVDVGPGSFTGIRTGIATLKTLSQFLNLPIYGFNAFELLAALHGDEPVSIYIDALQGRTYHASLTWSGSQFVYSDNPSVVTLESTENLTGLNKGRAPALTLISETLIPRFLQGGYSVIENANAFTPDTMLNLLGALESPPVVSWQNLEPLYLQPPNITPRKPKPGRLS